jgi:hypothetical protein
MICSSSEATNRCDRKEYRIQSFAIPFLRQVNAIGEGHDAPTLRGRSAAHLSRRVQRPERKTRRNSESSVSAAPSTARRRVRGRLHVRLPKRAGGRPDALRRLSDRLERSVRLVAPLKGYYPLPPFSRSCRFSVREGEEMLLRPDVDGAVAQGRGGPDSLAKVVAGQHLQLFAGGINAGDHTIV